MLPETPYVHHHRFQYHPPIMAVHHCVDPPSIRPVKRYIIEKDRFIKVFENPCCQRPRPQSKRYVLQVHLLVYNNLEVNNTINVLYKALFMNWIFKCYFVSLSIIEFINHSEFMTGIAKLYNIEYTLKSH
jgi:hypothetical protein